MTSKSVYVCMSDVYLCFKNDNLGLGIALVLKGSCIKVHGFESWLRLPVPASASTDPRKH